MANKKSTFNHWIFSEFDTINKSLPIYRVVYALFLLVIILPKYIWISDYPDTFFLPRIGITLFFTGFPDITFFYLINFLLIVSLLSLLVGYKTFYSSIAVALLLFIGNSWQYSFGKVNHDIVIIILPLLLSASCWGKQTSTKNDIPKWYTWPVPIFALLLGLAMLTAAMAKIFSGWLDPSTSALTGHLVRYYFVAERETLTASFLLSQNSFYLFKVLDYSTIIIESAFIFTVFSLRYFRLACALACFFHLGVQLTLEISFTTNILAYALFVNWSYLYKFENVKKWLFELDKLSNKIGIVGLILASIPIWIIYTFWGNPFNFELGLSSITGGNFINTCVMIASVIISAKYIYQLVINHEVNLEFRDNLIAKFR